MTDNTSRRLRARVGRAPRALCALAAVLGFAVAVRSAPVIITENNSTRAIAVDAVSRMRDPFSTVAPGLVGTDRRARVVFFVLNLDLLAGEP
ncbi:MAG: hypothetical protein ACJ741_10930, partial [Pyrinomonadaceae bacterium]